MSCERITIMKQTYFVRYVPKTCSEINTVNTVNKYSLNNTMWLRINLKHFNYCE